MGYGLLVIPLAFLFMASIFSPSAIQAGRLGVANLPQQIICTVNGCYSNLLCNPDGSCSTITGVSPKDQCLGVNPSLIHGAGQADIISQIPILGNIYLFFAGIGASLDGNQQLASSCNKAASVFFTFTYDTSSTGVIQYALIDVLFVILGIVALSSIQIAGSGLNTGAVLAIIVGGSLLMFWVILSGQAILTFEAIPFQWGAYLYFILTIGYALGIVTTIGVAAD